MDFMPDSKDLIQLRDITRVYRMGEHEVRALAGVSLEVKHNEYVAIMGPSGSGKSTLMNIIGCLDSLTSGQYELNGTDVSFMSDNELAEIRNKEIGFVFQTFNLLPRYTAFENVVLPLVYAGVSSKERQKRAQEVIESVGLTDRAHHKPNEL